MNSERVQFANTLRGLASVSVLIAHLFHDFWSENRGVVAHLLHVPELPLAQFAYPTYLLWLREIPGLNWSAFGVALFFLVSGFVIPFSLKNSTWGAFLVGRFFRIVPLYMVGFSVTLSAIWLVDQYFGVPWPFSLQEVLAHYIPGVRDLLWSTPIDGIVWTLEIEMKFYVLCALSIVLLRRRSLLVFFGPLAVAVFGVFVANHLVADGSRTYLLGLMALGATPYLVFMFIGVVFHYAHVGAIESSRAILMAGGLFFIFAVLLTYQVAPGQIYICWNYGFAVLLFGFAASFPQFFRSTRIGDFFADISYPLYVIHGVAGYAALRVLMHVGAKAWLSLIIVTMGAIGLAWLLHVLVEVPCHVFGKKIARNLTVGRVSAAQGAPAE